MLTCCMVKMLYWMNLWLVCIVDFTRITYRNTKDVYTISNTSSIDCQVNESLQTVNNPVVPMGTAMQSSTTKLSVMSGENLAMVHINSTKQILVLPIVRMESVMQDSWTKRKFQKVLTYNKVIPVWTHTNLVCKFWNNERTFFLITLGHLAILQRIVMTQIII